MKIAGDGKVWGIESKLGGMGPIRNYMNLLVFLPFSVSSNLNNMVLVEDGSDFFLFVCARGIYWYGI